MHGYSGLLFERVTHGRALAEAHEPEGSVYKRLHPVAEELEFLDENLVLNRLK